MTENTNTPTKMKQLKKNDLLFAISTEPMTRGEIVDALEEYEFIDSYLTYLIDHFEAQRKIIVERDEDGNVVSIARKAPKSGSTGGKQNIYRVLEVFNEETQTFEFQLETAEIEGAMGEGEKEGGFRYSINAAVKAANQENFAQYKARGEAIKALLPAKDEPEAE